MGFKIWSEETYQNVCVNPGSDMLKRIPKTTYACLYVAQCGFLQQYNTSSNLGYMTITYRQNVNNHDFQLGIIGVKS